MNDILDSVGSDVIEKIVKDCVEKDIKELFTNINDPKNGKKLRDQHGGIFSLNVKLI